MLAIFFLIFLGFVGWKFFRITERSLTRLLFYIVIPVVICKSIMTSKVGTEWFLLPILSFFLATLISTLSYYFSHLFWRGQLRNLIGYASGQGNYLFFWLSLALLFVWPDAVTIVVAMGLGYAFFENTLGIIYASQKWRRFSLKTGLKNFLKLPTLYAAFFGIVLRFFGVELQGLFLTMWDSFTSAIIILWMLVVGISFSHVRRDHFDLKFLSYLFFIKFLIWPLFMLIFIFLDSHYFHLFDSLFYQVFLILSLKPLGVNSIVIAHQRHLDTQRMAMAVFLSTMFALVYAPLIFVLVKNYFL